jgi:acyl carrier protein
MPDLASDVIAVISNKAPAGRKEIALSDSLQDIGIESIDALEMIFDLEEKFGIQIPYNANNAGQEFATVGDVVKAIEELVEKKS